MLSPHLLPSWPRGLWLSPHSLCSSHTNFLWVLRTLVGPWLTCWLFSQTGMGMLFSGYVSASFPSSPSALPSNVTSVGRSSLTIPKVVILPMPNPRAPHSITLYYFSPYHTLPPDTLYTYMYICIYFLIVWLPSLECQLHEDRTFFFNPLLYTQLLQESQVYKRFSICGKWKSERVKEWMNIKSLKNVHGISPNLRIHAR